MLTETDKQQHRTERTLGHACDVVDALAHTAPEHEYHALRQTLAGLISANEYGSGQGVSIAASGFLELALTLDEKYERSE